MKMFYKISTLIGLMLLGFMHLTAQTTVTIPTSGNQIVNNCIVNFYDNGGATGNYTNNVNGSVTFTPANPGTAVNITFNSFDLENNADFLYIYNGNSTSAPLLGVYTGNSLPPSAIANNANGALTIRMFTDASGTAAGFDATISCMVPCSVDSATVSGIPSLVPYGTTIVSKVCIGQGFTLNGHPVYKPFTDTTNTTYKWDMGDGTTYYTQTISHSYPATGIYQVLLTVTDTTALCYRQKSMKVFVTQTPDFSATVFPDTVCQYDTFALNGSATFAQVKEICAPPIADTTFLPDGSGASYVTSITADCFDPAEVITSATDLSVYINMEHSYLGDLEMRIICPNGQNAILKQYPAGTGQFLGGPNDPGVGDNVPGVGWTYEFKQDAVWGTMIEQVGVAGFMVPSPNPATPGNSLPAGEYKPFQNFSSLIGCPLNGAWSVQITDNLLSDNGFIFFWGINFDPKFESNLDSFQNTVVQQNWSADPAIYYSNNNIAHAKVDTYGTYCFTYNVVNDFGCSFDTTVCVFVKQAPINVLYDSICPGQDLYGYTETGVYYDTFSAANNCDSIRILHLYKRPIVDVIDLGPDLIVCQYDTILLEPTVEPYAHNYMYQWRIYPQTGSIHDSANYFYTAGQSEDIVFGAKAPDGCWRYDTISIIVNPGDFLQVPITDTGICPGDTVQLFASGAVSYQWSPSKYLSDANVANPVARTEVTTLYTLIGTSDKGCTDTQTVLVTVHPAAVLELPDNINIYAGEVYQMQPPTNASYFQWFPDAGLSNANISDPRITPTVDTRYFVTARTEYGCEIQDSVDVWVKETVMDMPNAFNPNNSQFKAEIRGLASIELFEIYNRWGQKVFETKNMNQGWDGSLNGAPQPMGVYVYVIQATTVEGKAFKKTGNVTLVR